MMRRNFAVGVVLGLVLCGCATGEPDMQAERDRVWGRTLGGSTTLTASDDTLRIDASAGPFTKQGGLEHRVLLRAAGEAVSREAEAFVLTFASYKAVGPGALFSADYAVAGETWIGSYEGLLAARAEANPLGTLDGPFKGQRLTVVVRFLSPDEAMGREVFDAARTYEALMAAKITD